MKTIMKMIKTMNNINLMMLETMGYYEEHDEDDKENNDEYYDENEDEHDDDDYDEEINKQTVYMYSQLMKK